MKACDIWERTLRILENTIAEVVFDTMIAVCVPVSYENGVLTVRAKNDFYRETIANRYIHEITRSARAVAGDEIEVSVISPEWEAGPRTPTTAGPAYAKTNLRQRYSFDTFVPGKCNELAYAAARAVADSLGQEEYNPLFLYGDVGLGKTHLVHAIGNHVLDTQPDMRVLYVSSATFTDEFIASIRERTTQDFRRKYRSVDALLVDDVQFLAGKKETQEEMFHTFNELYALSKQIVFTSDVPPRELCELEERLTNRFTSGLVADVNIPDYETRTAILEKKLSMERLQIPRAVKEFIIANIVSNIRDMEGALNKVMACAKLTNKPLTLELAQQALKDQLVKGEKRELTLEYIREVVARHFKLTEEEIHSKRRTRAIVLPRQIAMYLSRKLLDVTIIDVSRFYSRDHSTVISATNKIAGEMETDVKMRLTVADLEIELRQE